MSDGSRALREEIIATAVAMNAAGINRGTSGNVSARYRDASYDGFLITPSGLAYERTRAEDIAAVTLAGEASGPRAPSSEWRFHLDIYRSRADVHAIVHTHAPFATTLACMDRAIPAFHYMVAIAGGRDIRCAPYATFGTQKLSEHAVRALEDRLACLLEHHGMIAVGPSLSKAMWLAVEVEALARQYHGCLQIGTPRLLPKAEIKNVLGRIAGYGPAGK